VTDKAETVKPEEIVVAKVEEDPAPEGGGDGGRGGNSRFDPMSMFNGMDADKDGKLTVQELEGNRMADRLKTLEDLTWRRRALPCENEISFSCERTFPDNTSHSARVATTHWTIRRSEHKIALVIGQRFP